MEVLISQELELMSMNQRKKGVDELGENMKVMCVQCLLCFGFGLLHAQRGAGAPCLAYNMKSFRWRRCSAAFWAVLNAATLLTTIS